MSLIFKLLGALLGAAAIKALLEYLNLPVDEILEKIGFAKEDDSTDDDTATA